MMSVTSSEPLSQQSFAPWNPGEPNGDIIENCGILRKHRVNENKAVWNDISCSQEACVACNIPVTPVFVLRGMLKIVDM